MGRILAVHDEEHLLGPVEKLLRDRGHTVCRTMPADDAVASLDGDGIDLVLLHLHSPGGAGLSLFRRLRRTQGGLPVVVVASQGTLETAVEVARLGAFDYYSGPFRAEEMVASVERALRSREVLEHAAQPETPLEGDSAIIGQSPAMQEVYQAIGRAARADVPVLLVGEAGTGKEMLARSIHRHSPRASRALLAVDCRMGCESALECEIFGRDLEAGDGDRARRMGKLERTHDGTVFLDEVGELSLLLQGRLAHALEHRCFERVGGDVAVRMDARILAATSRDLGEAIGQGQFREDLYDRLGVVTIRVPALRERREDVPLLTLSFLRRFARELQVEPPPIANEALDALIAHPWPGNVRELELCVQRALVLSRGYPIQADDVARAFTPAIRHAQSGAGIREEQRLLEILREHLRPGSLPHAHREFLEKVERLMILEALTLSHGNQTRAAELLGLPRPTLHAKMEKYGIHTEKSVQVA